MIKYRRPRKHELMELAQIFAGAFANDPLCAHIKKSFKSEEKYLESMALAYLPYIKVHYKTGAVFVSDEDKEIKCFCILSHPGTKSAGVMDFIRAGGLKAVPKVGLFKLLHYIKLLDEAAKPCEEMNQHAWIIETLMVKPGCQGKGIGSRMLRDCIMPYVMDYCEEGKKETIVLYTNTESNRQFYKKRGLTEFDATMIGKGKQIGNWSFKIEVGNV